MTSLQKLTDESTTTLEWIRLADIRIPPHAQRDLKPHFVATLEPFDPDLFGIPVVSERGGVYHLLDGQQRTAKLREWLGAGWEDQRMQCRVYHGLTDAQEAALFLKLQHHLNVGAYDKFDKAVNAGLEPEVSIVAIVTACGLHVSRGRTPGGIVSVDALRRVYGTGNGAILCKTLRIITDAYGDVGLEGAIIRGVGMMCQRYDGALDFDFAVHKLAKARGGVKGLLNAAVRKRASYGCTQPVAVAGAAVEIINQGRGGKKLAPWWKVGSTGLLP
jgi:hypothetical protein